MSLPPSQLRRLCHVIPVQGFPFKLNAWRDGCRIYATKLEHLLFWNLIMIFLMPTLVDPILDYKPHSWQFFLDFQTFQQPCVMEWKSSRLEYSCKVHWIFNQKFSFKIVMVIYSYWVWALLCAKILGTLHHMNPLYSIIQGESHTR